MMSYNIEAPIEPRWLSVAQAASYTSLSERYIRQLIKEKELESFLLKRDGKNGGRRLISRESIDSFLDRNGWREMEDDYNDPF